MPVRVNSSDPLCALQQAGAAGANLVVLPEMWNCPYSNDSFPVYAEDIDGGASQSVQALGEVRGKQLMQGGRVGSMGDVRVRYACW